MRLFGTDGIRDLAGEGPLAPDFVALIGRAIADLLKADPKQFRHERLPGTRRTVTRDHTGVGKVLIARDTRRSGAEIERKLVEGFGLGTMSVGVLPTPGAAYLVRKWNCSLGIVISASHNPPEYNGIKLLAPDGSKVPDEAERAVEQYVEVEVPPPPSFVATLDFSNRRHEYAGFLRSQLGAGALKGRRIVVDAAHGAASAIAPGLFRALGADVIAVNCAPDGNNINVDAGVLEPDRLAAVVRRENAALGCALDGDADRCILVDETGTVRDGDFLLGVAAAWLDGRGQLPGRTVVSTVMANWGLEKFLRDRGLALVRTAVGDRYVVDEMLRIGAPLGGEASGHVVFLDALPTGDGMLTALRVLRIMIESGKPLSRLCAGLSKIPQKLVNVTVREKPDLASRPAIADAILEAERRLSGKGRLLVRYSGTEPLCRVMAEGEDAALVDQAVERVVDAVRKSLGA